MTGTLQTRGPLGRKATGATALALANAPLGMAKPRGRCVVLRVNGRIELRINGYLSVPIQAPSRGFARYA